MSTSPTSDPVALFWGNAWWLPGQNEPVPVTDPGQAAAVLAAAWPFGSRRLRLLYEPDGFRAEAADCPQANRATLGWALSDRFPELAEPELGWSHEPIRARGEGFVTLLHLETTPGLLHLVEALSDAGLTVTEAWPVPTWLQMLPSDLSDSGAFVGALLTRERVCLYHEAADGSRGIERWQGPDALDGCRTWLRERLIRQPETAVWLVLDHVESLTDIDLSALLDQVSNPQVVPLEEALGLEAVFPYRHPAQLLPARSRFSRSALMSAASWALLQTALGWAGLTGWSWFHAQEAEAKNRPALAGLRAEVDHLRTNATEIARLRSAVEASKTVFASDLLAELVHDLPPDMVFDRFEVGAFGFVVEGWTPPDASVGPAWLEQLKAARPDWQWQFAPLSHGAFRLEARPS